MTQKNTLDQLMSRPEVIKVILQSLTETISQYTHSQLHPGKPVIKEDGFNKNLAIAGLIRFEGPQLKMELFLGLSFEMFSAIYEALFQTPPEEISQDNQDLAGEILNVAFGSMDPHFRKLGLSLRSSLPKIYSGEKLKEKMSELHCQALVIPYETNGRTFNVDIYAADSLQVDWVFDPKSNAA